MSSGIPAIRRIGSALPTTADGSSEKSTAAQILAQARDVVEPAQRAVVDQLSAEVRGIVGYHAGWWDVDGRPASRVGKAVRPALVLACARAAAVDVTGARKADARRSAAVVAAAVAVELIHDFSLLHDDVIDQDLTRRHRPTSWKLFGLGEALLVGDVLMILAVQQLVSAEPVRMNLVTTLVAAARELFEGQFADLKSARRTSVSLDECLRMAETKTGALLGAACEMGALAVGTSPPTATAYRQFGRHLGVAFQLTDDLLGIWGDPAVTGKPAGSDLAFRRMSLPVVAALASGDAASKELASLYHGSGDLDPPTVARARDLVEAAGGRAWVEAEADRRILAAQSALERVDPDPNALAELQVLAGLIVQRNR